MPFPTYLQALEEFNARSENAEFDFFKENDNVLGISSAKSLLSIGAGDGYAEEQLSEKGLLKNLQNYHAVEPDVNVIGKLKSRLQALFPEAQMDFQQSGADEFQGTKRKFDIILIMRMLSYIDNKVDLFRLAYSLLNEGGKIIIVHYKSATVINKFGDVFGIRKRQYFSNHVADDLEKANLRFKEYFITDYFNHRGTSKQIAQLYFTREVSDLEFEKFRQFFEESVPSGREPLPQSVFVIEKPKIIEQNGLPA